ncbi:uncharacterized protein JN550_012241 [Neoarthrinium moseri]|uniref:uncharacterized protein n=1 Tax=Neoarthrinium moseri TaxID=1658444 RepID=UPI001FDE0333|nr:uncharacterized protein JN550_012241 [Neoarthrinium moseri]KAI1858979.1 hypothetical protein JN550_012241 [Neoarthrinium moseri]
MERWLQHYIPAGCLRVGVDETEIPPEVWILSDLHQGWRFFVRGGDTALDQSSLLPAASQAALLGSRALAPFAGLFHARWIQLSFHSGTVRVYIFPHDIDWSITSRGGRDGRLAKALSLLLRQLDYSPYAWSRSADHSPWREPRSPVNISQDDDEEEECAEDCSLLERFNKLPSPNPRLDLVTPDSFNSIAMQGILESRLPGLHTPLYEHQRRSAAVMLQREVEPGRVVDPRLRPALDQDQQPWYRDVDAGLVLREPRLYDGISGGILAEEMGTGKTLICLAVILATKHLPAEAPDPLLVNWPTRPRVASLMDMAAAAVQRYSYPWKLYLSTQPTDSRDWYRGCVKALESHENRAYYELRNPLVETRKCGRVAIPTPPARKIYLSGASLIIVPANLVTQWQQEIRKHTSGLRVLTLAESKAAIPPLSVLLGYDIIIFSQHRFEKIERDRIGTDGRPLDPPCPLEHMRFKRCIIDEGHKLGSHRSHWKSDLTRGLERLHIAAKWVVTGTPSRGLYGVDQTKPLGNRRDSTRRDDLQAINKQERDDLQRIGNIASSFLKARPWSNTRDEVGDTIADWNKYVLQPRHHSKSNGRKDCLKATLESLIIRNRLSDVSHHLPSVEEKIVFLDGSYQDRLSLNVFSMMIIFNSIQSQRTDQDYFFHTRNRKDLLQLVSNLRQASFFGSVFFSVEEIRKSIETAEDFLKRKDVPISPEDNDILNQAINFGKIASNNQLKAVCNQFHSMPLYLKSFPGGNGKHWSLDDRDTEETEPVCTDAGLILELQKYLNPCLDAPTSLNLMIQNGDLARHGDAARAQAAQEANHAAGNSSLSSAPSSSLAGNTSLGIDRHSLRKSTIPSEQDATDASFSSSEIEIAQPLAMTQIISTISAKLSYLIDSIVRHKDEEQIIVFYDNDNVAWYLAAVLEILQIHHLIYSRKGLDAKRRAQYVSTFTNNPKFRVLLMDISQAAFGLDMRSASRIYFVSPVLNPQVEAQAIGRARRISQQKPVTVETLVLRNSIEEVIVERRKNMTAAEHRKVKNILDDKPMYNWILNAKIMPMPEVEDDVAQTARLKVPQLVFGRGFGRQLHPDEDLIMDSPEAKDKERGTVLATEKVPISFKLGGLKRSRASTPAPTAVESSSAEAAPRVKKRARVAFADDA